MNENISLTEAAARYLASLPPEQRQATQQEVNKFVQWYGRERRLTELSAHEVANYADTIGNSATVDPMKKLEPVKAFLSYLKKEKLAVTNFALHLKARKGTTKRVVASEKQPHREPAHLTAEGYAELKSQLSALQNERPRVTEDIRTAMADKDFRENAPLDAAKESQGQLEARIRELESALQGATVISERQTKREKVVIGSKVVLRDLARGQEVSYTLVTPREANPARGKLSSASPTGGAVLGRGKGDVIEVKAPAGTLRYQIIDISAG